jgi:hypothetical protein
MRHLTLHRLIIAFLVVTLAFPALYAAPPAEVLPAAPAKATVSGLWSYQSVRRPEIPVVQQKAWVRTPIDAFILAELEAKGIKPSPDTDRATFVAPHWTFGG